MAEPRTDGANRVAVGQRLAQPLECNDADASTRDRAVGLRVKRPAVAVGRHDAARLVEVARRRQPAQEHASSERHIALMQEQLLTRHVHGHERGRARRLDREARSFQIQLVGDASGQEVTLVAERRFEGAAIPHHLGVAAQVVFVVRVPPGAGKDANRRVGPAGVIACRFQRFPSALEEQAVLRIEELGFARAEAEEERVEPVCVFEHDARADVVGAREKRGIHACRDQLIVGEDGDRLHAVADVLPERVDRSRARKTTRETDDGDLGTVEWSRVTRIAHRVAFSASRCRSASRLRSPRPLAFVTPVVVLVCPEIICASDSTVGCSNIAATGIEPPNDSRSDCNGLRRQERVAAKLEEVVAHAHPIHAEQFHPDRRDRALHVGGRRHVRVLEIRPLVDRQRAPLIANGVSRAGLGDARAQAHRRHRDLRLRRRRHDVRERRGAVLGRQRQPRACTGRPVEIPSFPICAHPPRLAARMVHVRREVEIRVGACVGAEAHAAGDRCE